MGTEGRKPSAETGPRIPRPGGFVRSDAASRKTMSGVAPAANPPPLVAGAPLADPLASHDDTHADTHAGARVEPPADAASGHDDAATAHGLPPDMLQALADLARDRASHAPVSAPPPSTSPVSKPPVSTSPPSIPPPATKRMASNAPIAPRAPSVAPPPIAPRSAPSVAPYALPMPPSYVPDPRAPSYALAPPSLPPPQPGSWLPPPPMRHAPQLSQTPMYAPPHAGLPVPSTPRAFAPPSGFAGASDEESAPLTYQVYAADSVPPPRPMNMSRMSMPDFAPKPNIKARLGLGLVAACVFVATVVLIIAGASDDPPRSKKTAAAAATSAAPTIAAATLLVAPVVIAPPAVDPAPAASAAVTDPPPAPAPKAKAKGKGAGSAAARGATLPPNPFAAGAPAKPAKKK